MDYFKNKVIIVTGASEGIGRALALALAPLGCRLLLTARNESRLASLQQEVRALGSEALIHVADLSDSSQCSQVVTACIEYFGQ